MALYMESVCRRSDLMCSLVSYQFAFRFFSVSFLSSSVFCIRRRYPPFSRPSMPTLETYRGVYIWRYVPSLPLSVTFAAIFGIAATAHGWKMYKTQLWFCLPFVLGGFCRFSSEHTPQILSC